MLDRRDDISCCWLFILIRSLRSHDGVLLFEVSSCFWLLFVVLLALIGAWFFDFGIFCSEFKFCGDDEKDDGDDRICESEEDDVKLFISDDNAASAF